jgi:hypothetical protein
MKTNTKSNQELSQINTNEYTEPFYVYSEHFYKSEEELYRTKLLERAEYVKNVISDNFINFSKKEDVLKLMNYDAYKPIERYFTNVSIFPTFFRKGLNLITNKTNFDYYDNEVSNVEIENIKNVILSLEINDLMEMKSLSSKIKQLQAGLLPEYQETNIKRIIKPLLEDSTLYMEMKSSSITYDIMYDLEKEYIKNLEKQIEKYIKETKIFEIFKDEVNNVVEKIYDTIEPRITHQNIFLLYCERTEASNNKIMRKWLKENLEELSVKSSKLYAQELKEYVKNQTIGKKGDIFNIFSKEYRQKTNELHSGFVRTKDYTDVKLFLKYFDSNIVEIHNLLTNNQKDEEIANINKLRNYAIAWLNNNAIYLRNIEKSSELLGWKK